MTMAAPCTCLEEFRLSLAVGESCTSTGSARDAVIPPNTCTTTASGQINALLVNAFVGLISEWNVQVDTCSQSPLAIQGDPQTYANDTMLVDGLRSIKLSDCTSADTLGSFDFYSDTNCQFPVASFAAVPRTCAEPRVLNFTNPITNNLQSNATVPNSCMNASLVGRPTVSIPILIDFTVLNPTGRCAATPNSGTSDKLSAGDDVGITIGVLFLIVGGVVALLYHKNGQRNQSLGELNSVMLDIVDVEEQSMQLIFDEEVLDDTAIGARGSISTAGNGSFKSSLASESGFTGTGGSGSDSYSGARRF